MKQSNRIHNGVNVITLSQTSMQFSFISILISSKMSRPRSRCGKVIVLPNIYQNAVIEYGATWQLEGKY